MNNALRTALAGAAVAVLSAGWWVDAAAAQADMRSTTSRKSQTQGEGLHAPPPVSPVLSELETFARTRLAGGTELKVITVPWLGVVGGSPEEPAFVPHAVWSGGELILQGTAKAQAGCNVISAVWDPGDGTGPVVVPHGNLRALELAHTYTSAPGTPHTASLTVSDDCGNEVSDDFFVLVTDQSLETEVNMAIDHGLWYLHKTQQISMAQGVETGFWPATTGASTAAGALLAFQVNGHREIGDPDENPYVEDVARGMAYLFTQLSVVNIAPQTAGDPDANGNTIGVQAAVSNLPIYEGGQVVDAIVASGTPNAIAPTGDVTWVQGETYGTIVQDMMDAYAWGQVDTGSARGGWRYSWNSGSDNSAAQWWAIGGLAAEQFGAVVPAWVKQENLDYWLAVSQILTNGDANEGRFGYTNTTPIDVNGANTTPSGMVQLILDGVPRADERFADAEHFMGRDWLDADGSSLTNSNRIYGMFAMAKAMRLANGGAIVMLEDGTGNSVDWYGADPVAPGDPLGLARFLVETQQANDSWIGSGWVTSTYRDLATSWAIIILSPTIFEQPPVAICAADPDTTGVGVPIEFDGSGSFHLDPAQTLVSWCWDFGDGSSVQCGEQVTHTYDSIGDYPVQLTVTDQDGDEDTTSCLVRIVPPPIPPDSNPGGPYFFCGDVGAAFVVDGTASFDPDGELVLYEWDFDNDGVIDATGPTPDAYAFYSAIGQDGLYIAVLKVTDNDGLMDSDFTSVVVNGFTGECPTLGACCLPDGSCASLTLSECQGLGGFHQGVGSVCGETCCPIVLDFETEDDFVTVLLNGQDISTPPEFGHLVAISGSGANDGPAIFDSTIGGPNADAPDTDLLVDSGNILILQANNSAQSVDGFFDVPNDSANGGALRFDFLALPCEEEGEGDGVGGQDPPSSGISVLALDLIDICPGQAQDARVTLTDVNGFVRVYEVESGFTGDGGGPTGIATLDTTTLTPQIGPGGAAAVAWEDDGFDASSLASMDVWFQGSGGLDSIVICRPLVVPPPVE